MRRKKNGNQNFPELINRNWFEIWQLNRRSDWCAGKLAGGGDSVSSHQGAPRSSPNGNVFTGQFAGSGLSAGTPLRGTISIKLSSQLHATDAASSLADADDSEETGTSLQRSSVGSSPDSSSSDAQVNITARVCGGGGGVPPCVEWWCEMDNQATTPFSYCLSTAFVCVQPHWVNARWNRCQEDLNSLPSCWTGGDHQDDLVLCGWRLSSRTWNPITSPWMKQLTWLRIIHSGDWCLRLALRTASGVCQKWRRKRSRLILGSSENMHLRGALQLAWVERVLTVYLAVFRSQWCSYCTCAVCVCQYCLHVNSPSTNSLIVLE